VANFLRKYWFDESVACWRDLVAREGGAASFKAWCQVDPNSAEAFVRFYDAVLRELQSPTPSENVRELLEAIWREACRRGEVLCHAYPDVPRALQTWAKAGLDIRTYSALSRAGQRSLLVRTEQGDLLRYVRAHYDAQLGPSWAPRSLAVVATDMGLPARAILFVSDDATELDRARAAGFTTLHLLRPGSPPLPAGTRYASIEDLRNILVG
jgi:2,3-diketo-5-methylthio-1-phosphopentane phosphatase